MTTLAFSGESLVEFNRHNYGCFVWFNERNENSIQKIICLKLKHLVLRNDFSYIYGRQ